MRTLIKYLKKKNQYLEYWMDEWKNEENILCGESPDIHLLL
jgi:hypothetical protein